MSEKREKLHQDIKKIKDLSKKSTFLSEFKEFINRGSVIDLAVGVVIGGAFSAIVTSLVNDIIMPIVSLLGGGFDFTELKVTIPNFFTGEAGATIQYGNFIQNVVNFLIIALTIFIFIRFINRLKRKDECETVEEKEDEQIALLKEIRDSLKKSK